MDELQHRAGRGIALAALAVACVVVGPVPRLTDAFERTYAVAIADERRTRVPNRDRVPPTGRHHRPGPRPARPRGSRP